MISYLKEIFAWRGLLLGLAAKDLKLKYRQASGGFGWMLIMPLAQAVVFSFIFGFIFRIKIENYALFLLSGLFAWGFLRSSLDGALNAILANSSLIKKTYFPRQILIFSPVMVNLLSFFVSLAVLSAFCAFLGKMYLLKGITWLFILVFIQITLTAGISLLIAALNTVYRETQFLADIFLLVWFYATPVVYSLEMVSKALSAQALLFYQFNPMVGLICGYQNIFVYGRPPDLRLISFSALGALVSFILGMIIFKHYEKRFEDMV